MPVFEMPGVPRTRGIVELNGANLDEAREESAKQKKFLRDMMKGEQQQANVPSPALKPALKAVQEVATQQVRELPNSGQTLRAQLPEPGQTLKVQLPRADQTLKVQELPKAEAPTMVPQRLPAAPAAGGGFVAKLKKGAAAVGGFLAKVARRSAPIVAVAVVAETTRDVYAARTGKERLGKAGEGAGRLAGAAVTLAGRAATFKAIEEGDRRALGIRYNPNLSYDQKNYRLAANKARTIAEAVPILGLVLGPVVETVLERKS